MRITSRMITRSALILALAIAVQSVKLPQLATGPLVNTLLFMATALAGSLGGVMVGLFTPLLALAFGIMPLAPVVPIIMLGNAALALIFGLLRKRPYLGIVLAAVAKYGVMTAGLYLMPLIVNIKLPAKIVAALSTPQLFTALGGGILALILLGAMQWLNISHYEK